MHFDLLIPAAPPLRSALPEYLPLEVDPAEQWRRVGVVEVSEAGGVTPKRAE